MALIQYYVLSIVRELLAVFLLTLTRVLQKESVGLLGILSERALDCRITDKIFDSHFLL